VNDALALKQANVGIAVSGSTDAARGAADVVLLSAGLSVIAESIVESRRIFARMQAYATFRISSSIAQLLFFTVAALAWDYYLPPFALVIMALANDFTVISVAFDNARYKKLPVDWNMKVLIAKSTVIGTKQTAKRQLQDSIGVDRCIGLQSRRSAHASVCAVA